MSLLRQKLLAFTLHLAIGFSIVVPFLLFCLFVLYTPPILELEGGKEIALIVLGLDLALGPLLTLIVYRRGKPGLKFDLVLIAVVQISAFAYGAWTLYSQRPLYLAFVVEHFRILPAADIDPGTLTDPRLAPRILGGPRPVYVERPEGEEGTDILMDSVMGGRDVQYYPKYYRPLDDHLARLPNPQFRLETLKKSRPEAAADLERQLARQSLPRERILFVPILGFSREGTVLLDRETGEILDYLVDVVIW